MSASSNARPGGPSSNDAGFEAMWSSAVALFAVPRVARGSSETTRGGSVFQAAAIAVLIAGSIWTIRRPPRGIQDRIAGTWLVPR